PGVGESFRQTRDGISVERTPDLGDTETRRLKPARRPAGCRSFLIVSRQRSYVSILKREDQLMPEDVRPDQPQPERTNHGPSSKGSESPGGHRARPECCHDWRCGCEPDPYCRPAPPYWDPYCAPWPHHAWRRHHWAHFWPAPPDGGLFEAMMRFAAGAAGFRGRLWSEMADATRYAQRDWRYPWAPHPYGCDPCPPPWPSCDPCAPPRSHCDPCPPPHERCDDSEAPDAIDLKELRATL